MWHASWPVCVMDTDGPTLVCTCISCDGLTPRGPPKSGNVWQLFHKHVSTQWLRSRSIRDRQWEKAHCHSHWKTRAACRRHRVLPHGMGDDGPEAIAARGIVPRRRRGLGRHGRAVPGGRRCCVVCAPVAAERGARGTRLPRNGNRGCRGTRCARLVLPSPLYFMARSRLRRGRRRRVPSLRAWRGASRAEGRPVCGRRGTGGALPPRRAACPRRRRLCRVGGGALASGANATGEARSAARRARRPLPELLSRRRLHEQPKQNAMSADTCGGASAQRQRARARTGSLNVRGGAGSARAARRGGRGGRRAFLRGGV